MKAKYVRTKYRGLKRVAKRAASALLFLALAGFYNHIIDPAIFGSQSQTQSTQEVSKCEYSICESFTDFKNWKGYEPFIVVDTNPIRIRAPANKAFAGKIMDYTQTLAPGFDVVFTFIPFGEQGNVVFKYGDLFLVIADAYFDRIAVKKGDDYINPVGYKSGHFTLPEEIKPGTEVKVRFSVTTPEDSTFIELTVKKMVYYNNNGEKKELVSEDAPSFKIENTDRYNYSKASFGVGLLDPSRGGRIEASFEELLIQKDF